MRKASEELKNISSNESVLEDGEIPDNPLEEFSDELMDIDDQTQNSSNRKSKDSDRIVYPKKRTIQADEANCEVISSDEEYISSDDYTSNKKKLKYTTVERIMWQINTAAGSSRNYKTGYHKTKHHKHKRRLGFLSSARKYREKQKICKKRCKKQETNTSALVSNNSTTVKRCREASFDFDRQRQVLLEKLRTDKSGSDLTIVPMDIESNFDDIPLPDENKENKENVFKENTVNEETGSPTIIEDSRLGSAPDSEDDLDLGQLRLLALKSNKKRKSDSVPELTDSNSNKGDVKVENKTTENNSNNCNDETGNQSDEDETLQNELLLRAEALRTALLREHKIGKLKSLKNDHSKRLKEGNANKVDKEVFVITSGEENNLSDSSKSNLTKTLKTDVPKPCDAVLPSHFSLDAVILDDVKSPELQCTENISKSEPVDQLTRKSVTKKRDNKVNPVIRNNRVSFKRKTKPLVNQKSSSQLINKLTLNDKNKIRSNNNVLNRKVHLTKLNIKKDLQPETKRFVIHVGSDSTDDDDDEILESGLDESEDKISDKIHPPNNKPDAVPLHTQSSKINEESIELFLNAARENSEKKMNNKTIISTPEAVYKHLPLPQRLEYIKLKQKIAEKEKLIQTVRSPVKTVTGLKNETKVSELKVNVTLSPASLKKEPVVSALVTKTERSYTQIELKKKPATNTPNLQVKIIPDKDKIRSNTLLQRKRQASISTLQLETKQKLDMAKKKLKINQLQVLLKKIKIEKHAEEDLEAQVKKLKLQVEILEKRKKLKRLTIEKMVEESKEIYKQIQSDRPKKIKKESVSEVAACRKTDILKRVINEIIDKVVEMENTNINKPEVDPEHSHTVSSNSVLMSDKRKYHELNKVLTCEETSPSLKLKSYTSPLEHLNTGSCNSATSQPKLDPHIILCPFQLMGTCNDDECTYQHHTPDS